MNLGATVLSGLRGRHIDDLAREILKVSRYPAQLASRCLNYCCLYALKYVELTLIKTKPFLRLGGAKVSKNVVKEKKMEKDCVQSRALHGVGERSSRASLLEDLLVGSIDRIRHCV